MPSMKVLDKNGKTCDTCTHKKQQFIKFSEIGLNFCQNEFHKAASLL